MRGRKNFKIIFLKSLQEGKSFLPLHSQNERESFSDSKRQKDSIKKLITSVRGRELAAGLAVLSDRYHGNRL